MYVARTISEQYKKQSCRVEAERWLAMVILFISPSVLLLVNNDINVLREELFCTSTVH